MGVRRCLVSVHSPGEDYGLEICDHCCSIIGQHLPILLRAAEVEVALAERAAEQVAGLLEARRLAVARDRTGPAATGAANGNAGTSSNSTNAATQPQGYSQTPA